MLKFTHKRKSVTRLIVPVTFAVVLTACSSSPKLPTSVDIATPATLTAEQYLIYADSSEGSLAVDWQLLALKALIRDGMLPQADMQLARIAVMQLNPKQTAEWQMAKANLRYQQGETQEALESLNFQPWWQLESKQYRRYFQLRTQLSSELEEPIVAVRSRIELDKYLDPVQQKANWQSVWTTLTQIDNETLMATPLADDETVLRGWIQLRLLEERYAHRPLVFQEQLNSWKAQNRFHPAIEFMPEQLMMIADMEVQQASHIALLLPLNGRFSRQAEAVRNGFFAAMLENENRDPELEVTVYDTTAQPMASLVEQLAQDGIDYVVGPLIKETISDFQRLNVENLPILALNIPDLLPEDDASCYFTLSPENEAQQAALHLFDRGYQYPLILGPQSDFGQRVSDAFNQQWHQLSNHDADSQYYRERKELQQKINAVFGLKESQERIDQMEQLLALPLEAEQRSRRDIDAVYMVATQAELTLLKPFIEVAINPGTRSPALFTSSRSNAIDSTADERLDLQGLEFSDIPLLISDPDQFQPRIETMWPDTNANTIRLIALGMDAYLLTEELPQMQVIDNHQAHGQTGVLSIDENCMITREIEWAQINGDSIEFVQQ
ncbi:penicillin-binding protein activator [Thaumasiovibrio sp. DFM-14]|uniref:penicillin-binding protein activator n=1 Tax=Thaumasiovibrio sp. DFM-14 TaxID=3384792 RepID=UPI0039A3C0DB